MGLRENQIWQNDLLNCRIGDDGDKSTDSPDTKTDDTETSETSSSPNAYDDQENGDNEEEMIPITQVGDVKHNIC